MVVHLIKIMIKSQKFLHILVHQDLQKIKKQNIKIREKVSMNSEYLRIRN